MKILIVNQILYTADGGKIPIVHTIKDTMIYGMCLGFKSLGHDVTLIGADDYSPIYEEKYDCDVIFFKSNLRKVFLPSVLPFSFPLFKYLLVNKGIYDMIISSELFSFSTLFLAIICPRKTIVWQELAYHQSKFHKMPSKFWHNIIVPIFYRKIYAIVPRSIDAKAFASRFSQRISNYIIDHGINLEKFEVSKIKKRQIITSSQLVKRKNVDGIIKIYSELIKEEKYSDVKLLVAGRGDERAILEKLVAQLGINNNVSFLGFLSQKELNKVIKSSLCFLVNTRKDLNVVSIPESIVSGTPVLMNSVPASAFYIKQNKLGIVQDNWSYFDVRELIDNNNFYVNNCIKFRPELSNRNSAQKFIELFNQK